MFGYRLALVTQMLTHSVTRDARGFRRCRFSRRRAHPARGCPPWTPGACSALRYSQAPTARGGAAHEYGAAHDHGGDLVAGYGHQRAGQ